ncbi:MAG: hypothetical protein JWM47_2496 [Acidimicrobiales bacterium]|nr:hypothetical protein [Acidimicrobiales bacterium]
MGPSAGGRPVTGPNAVAWEIGARLRLVLESTGPPPGHRQHRPTDLAGVHLSSALLFGELARSDPTYATAAHESLQRAAMACASGLPAHRLFEGLVPVALVARLLATGPADYDEALAQLDARIVAATVDAVGEARASGDWPVGFSDHDQIQGLAGCCTYLRLAADSISNAALLGVLQQFTRLSRTREISGRLVPGWWVHHGPHDGTNCGHANHGMAHGVSAPLSALCQGALDGFDSTVGTATARAIVARLRDMVGYAEGVPIWPGVQTMLESQRPVPQHTSVVGSQLSWCYGSAGICAALSLAHRAFGDPWCEEVVETFVTGLVDRPDLADRFNSDSLCHGRAGLLRSIQRLGAFGGPEVDDLARELADRLAARADERAPWLYRYGGDATGPAGQEAVDDTGLLTGATGIALVLLDAGRQLDPGPSWDTILRLS